MSDFTDEQIEAALGAYRDALLVKTGAGIHWSLDREIPAMRAALHTLGPISVHKPVKVRDLCTHIGCDDSTLTETIHGDWVCGPASCTVCDTCKDEWGDNLDWPCPVAQAHEKENNA